MKKSLLVLSVILFCNGGLRAMETPCTNFLDMIKEMPVQELQEVTFKHLNNGYDDDDNGCDSDDKEKIKKITEGWKKEYEKYKKLNSNSEQTNKFIQKYKRKLKDKWKKEGQKIVMKEKTETNGQTAFIIYGIPENLFAEDAVDKFLSINQINQTIKDHCLMHSFYENLFKTLGYQKFHLIQLLLLYNPQLFNRFLYKIEDLIRKCILFTVYHGYSNYLDVVYNYNPESKGDPNETLFGDPKLCEIGEHSVQILRRIFYNKQNFYNFMSQKTSYHKTNLHLATNLVMEFFKKNDFKQMLKTLCSSCNQTYFEGTFQNNLIVELKTFSTELDIGNLENSIVITYIKALSTSKCNK